jgi:hypothetical protein
MIAILEALVRAHTSSQKIDLVCSCDMMSIHMESLEKSSMMEGNVPLPFNPTNLVPLYSMLYLLGFSYNNMNDDGEDIPTKGFIGGMLIDDLMSGHLPI